VSISIFCAHRIDNDIMLWQKQLCSSNRYLYRLWQKNNKRYKMLF